MDPTTVAQMIDALSQLGTAGAIVVSVVYLQKTQGAMLERLAQHMRPDALAKEVRKVTAKVDALAEDVSYMRGKLDIEPADRPSDSG